MSKFNLKNKKMNSDESIPKALTVQHKEAPVVVTERQLDKNRVEEKEVIIEKLLEKNRTGGADKIIEKNLNDSKGLFAPLRNSEAHTGNINKIEEKRLAGDKAEDEKYEPASEAPKSQRWWDNLKASNNKTVKVAARPFVDKTLATPRMDQWDEKEAWKALSEQTGNQEPEEGLASDVDPETEFIGRAEAPSVAEEIEETEEPEETITVLKQKETQVPLPTIYFLTSYDLARFDNIEEAKLATLDKILQVKPELEGKISIDDLKPTRDPGQLALRLIGKEYFEKPTEAETFSNYVVETVDVGGTPVSVGKLTVNEGARELDEETLTKDIVEYILEQDSEIADVDTLEKSLNLTDLKNGVVTFAIGTIPDLEEGTAGADIEEEGVTTQTPAESPAEEFPVVDTGVAEEGLAGEGLAGEGLAGEGLAGEGAKTVTQPVPPVSPVLEKSPEEKVLEELKKKEPIAASKSPVNLSKMALKKK